MHKFFVSAEQVRFPNIYIYGEDVDHIVKVLRLRNGDKIQISDGNGKEYICEIIKSDKKEVVCNIIESFDNETEAPINITLYQGLPKSQKMDLIVQKCVEIGVVRIVPVITNRVVVKVEGRDLKNKIERWQRIAYEAAKQSNRGIVPIVSDVMNFEEAIEEMKQKDLVVVPYEREKERGIKDLRDRKDIKDIAIFIGPEGGFEEEEIENCLDIGAIPVTLGPRILRTETAGFVTSALILYELGDLGGGR
ncbi:MULTISPECIES: 16S rRNA (uracil(1498)-N(3))-methyltransferase [unclassified Caloramator]|uniref:16S rRNA (uracil(1498)-N(3))-methyltransferase n=1 Tax=unclassified Caloramator TaxID=2629145 RepID=UPI00237DC5A4|nr:MULTISPECIES: 16S rRNA (uracil(1498)-N(3))-methyltransferase [unclassified Caloramator]MDO6354479.1 16S rRNA (uracil(1498)-N(3))-methyltransferase [Caloramator sp. CAR-1]WDU84171.1 16S rRNA (uracil(1498)-N(3))-methyltransferase [Caloramator sp. Dgby_cultured_2]